MSLRYPFQMPDCRTFVPKLVQTSLQALQAPFPCYRQHFRLFFVAVVSATVDHLSLSSRLGYTNLAFGWLILLKSGIALPQKQTEVNVSIVIAGTNLRSHACEKYILVCPASVFLVHRLALLDLLFVVLSHRSCSERTC